MSKKSWPNLYGKLLYKVGQDFLDTQYIVSDAWAPGVNVPQRRPPPQWHDQHGHGQAAAPRDSQL